MHILWRASGKRRNAERLESKIQNLAHSRSWICPCALLLNEVEVKTVAALIDVFCPLRQLLVTTSLLCLRLAAQRINSPQALFRRHRPMPEKSDRLISFPVGLLQRMSPPALVCHGIEVEHSIQTIIVLR